jgi:hypothetical protein
MNQIHTRVMTTATQNGTLAAVLQHHMNIIETKFKSVSESIHYNDNFPMCNSKHGDKKKHNDKSVDPLRKFELKETNQIHKTVMTMAARNGTFV